MVGQGFGTRTLRGEDLPLLIGRGRFVDDIRLPGTVHAAFVRSAHASARIRGIDLSAARALPGVAAVYSLADLAPHLSSPRLPTGMPGAAGSAHEGPYILAGDRLRYVGEPIAVAIAESRHVAEDAVDLVEVDVEALEPVVDCDAALAAGSPLVHEYLKGNVAARVTVAFGEVDRAFVAAARIVKATVRQHKGGGHSIEGRGVLARWDPDLDQLVVWSGTQMTHQAQRILVRLLGCAETQVRVIAPDVGGGFGPKMPFYPEEAVVALAAKLLGRPVKWIEDRRETFLASLTERDQVWALEMAVDAGARILGVRGSLLHDQGAYSARGTQLPYNSATGLPGPYLVPAMRVEVTSVHTNKVPVSAVRGAGYPQATLAMERMLDLVAREMGIDRAEIRRRNLIPPERMPYDVPLKTRSGTGITYDSGDYPACMAKALEASGWSGFPARQAAARAAGRYLGIGLANYVKGTGRGPYESAIVRIGPSGRITVYSGATAQGQGTKTTLAQICATQLGVSIDRITVVAGDTAGVPVGNGAFASRQSVVAGSAVHIASIEVRNKLLKVASNMLEAAEEDLELADGRVSVKGAPGHGISFGDVANALAGAPGFAIPSGAEPSLEATSHFMPEKLTYANGTHIAEVEVDIETGGVQLKRYVAINDVGLRINPMIVEGQLVGGIVHGIGNGMLEEMVFDGQAQPLTTTFADYLLPAATDLVRIELIEHATPSRINPLGVKGAGEAGTSPSAAVIVSAIEDAISSRGIRLTEVPITPARLFGALRRKR